jgi:hypothetical protein
VINVDNSLPCAIIVSPIVEHRLALVSDKRWSRIVRQQRQWEWVMGSPRDAWHESLRAEDQSAKSSERSFGLVFSGVFAIVGGLSYWRGGGAAHWWLIGAALFLVVALAAPPLLSPLNRLWAWIGNRLQVIVSPIAMAILFYGTVMPMGLLMRVFRKDPLRLRLDPSAASYWIERPPPGESRPSMKNQF